MGAQEAADAWRKGATPNSGPVLSLHQRQNPGSADNYADTFGGLESSLKDRQDKYYARVLWGNQQEEEANAWRGKPYPAEAALNQRRGRPDFANSADLELHATQRPKTAVGGQQKTSQTVVAQLSETQGCFIE